ncbi:unnamed protein product [Phyllotreta striolata]|uniref:GH18 domain-containing protein n=1 Tax=Phyllotreta striolata TaxID=444603 RepID=A0A9N9XMF1_PHYSR|nr:unnamed protein product [Phyllotreta striolata]
MNIGLRLFFVVILSYVCNAQGYPKVVCYYDGKGNTRQGQAKFDIAYLEPALQFCTHLIYGYAGIDPQTYKIKPLNDHLDVQQHNFQQITNLKKRFQGLRVLLSVGGDRDVIPDTDKALTYTNLLEVSDRRHTFISSAKDFIKNYGFDGIDLAWQMPRTKPKKIHSAIKKFFIGIKHVFAGESIVDEKAAEHREQFTTFVRDFRTALRRDALLLTLSVLPNVNSTVYYDVHQIAPLLDFVTLQNFDFYEPERNPYEADYTSPLYDVYGRKVDENGDFQVRYWLSKGCPGNKIIYGLQTFGRTWKLSSASGETGTPPVTIDSGAGEAGVYTQEPGLLSYNEVCAKLPTTAEIRAGYVGKLRKVNDPTPKKAAADESWQTIDVTKRFGTYAYKLPKDGQDGIWVSFQDPDTAAQIASYIRSRGLGGVAIVDLTLDDFKGLCTGNKYPILRASANMNL